MENFNTKYSHACLSNKWVLSELAYEYERILRLNEALLQGIAGAYNLAINDDVDGIATSA